MNFKNDITPPLLFTLFSICEYSCLLWWSIYLSTYLSIGCTWWRCGCRASRPTGRWTWRWRRSTTWWPWRSWTPPPPSCCPAAPPPSPALAPGTSKQSREYLSFRIFPKWNPFFLKTLMSKLRADLCPGPGMCLRRMTLGPRGSWSSWWRGSSSAGCRTSSGCPPSHWWSVTSPPHRQVADESYKKFIF